MIERKDMSEYTRKLNLEKHPYERAVTQKSNKIDSRFFENFEKLERTKMLEEARNVFLSKDLKEKELKDEMLKKMLQTIVASRGKQEGLIETLFNNVIRPRVNGANITLLYGIYEIPQKRVYEMGTAYAPDDLELYPHIVVSIKKGTETHGFIYPAYVNRGFDYDKIFYV